MDATEKAAQVIQQAEASMRELLGEAAKDGAYDDLATLAKWAKETSSLLARMQGAEQQQEATSETPEFLRPSTPSPSKRDSGLHKLIADAQANKD